MINKRLIIFVVVVLSIIMMAVFLVVRPKNKTNVPDPIVTTDPITGDKLITTPGVDPETGGVPSVGLPLLGGAKLYEHIDDDYAFILLRDSILAKYFKEKTSNKAKLMKLIPASLITKTVGGGTSGNAYKSADFDILTDINNDVYKVIMTYYPVEGLINVVIKDKAGTPTEYNDFTKLVN